jgi:hypothetical protein
MVDAHLVPPVHGRIQREWVATNGQTYFPLVEEERDGLTWLLLYGWDAGWNPVGVYLMGYLQQFIHEIGPRVARLVDVGTATLMLFEIVVVEEDPRGFWLLMYSWSWGAWRMGLVYFVGVGRYALPSNGETQDESDNTSGWDSESWEERELPTESLPSLSDNDYQDLGNN